MAKVDLIEELKDLGVTDEVSNVEGIEPLTGSETVKELEAILEAAKAARPESAAEDDPAAEEDEKPEPPSKKDAGESVDILSGKNFIRYYSREAHGDDFLALAEQLINKPEYAKRDYRIAPSSDTDVLEVRYREKEDAEKHLDEQSPDSPVVDKTKRFEDRDDALSFSANKHGTIVAVPAK